MNLEQIVEKFNLEQEILSELPNRITAIEVTKGNPFLASGNYADKIGVLIKGLLVSKYTDKEGNIRITKIFHEDGHRIISDYESFVKNKKSEETITAIEDFHIFVIKKSDFDFLLNEFDSIKRIAKELLEDNYLAALQRIRQLQTLSTIKRVEGFMSLNPSLINRLSRSDIASYLGMHRNMLSKALTNM